MTAENSTIDQEAIKEAARREMREEMRQASISRRSTIAIVLALISIVVAIIALGFSVFGPARVAMTAPALSPSSSLSDAGAGAVPSGPAPTQYSQTQPPRVATAADGSIYSFDPGTGQYFTMTAEGQVYVVQPDQVPADMRAQLAQAAPAAAPPSAAELDRATAQARAAISAGSEVENDDLVINQLLARPDVAAEFLSVLDRLAGIEATGEINPDGHPVFAFMDPRCPYCHRAFEELEGEVVVKWLPTLALGDGGDAIAATLLGAMTADRNDAGEITGVHFSEDAEREARLAQQLGGGDMPISTRTLTEEQSFALTENLTVLRQLYGRQGELLGVPTFIVPRADGTAIMMRGYDDANIAEIIRLSRERG